MAKDPAFLFYSKDWLVDTAEFMPDEKGVYIDLLCYQQQMNGLPDDTRRLAKMVGLSIDEFNRIWKVISHKFDRTDDRTDNRLVNRKLDRIISERSAKSKLNTIIGTFAGIIRKGGFSKQEYNLLKSSFQANDFIDVDSERLSERITEWLSFRLKSIGNANANGNIDVNITIEKRKEKFLNECNVFAEKYPSEMIAKFCDYWTEKNKSGVKMRYELEKTWEISKRLATWASRDKIFSAPNIKHAGDPISYNELCRRHSAGESDVFDKYEPIRPGDKLSLWKPKEQKQ